MKAADGGFLRRVDHGLVAVAMAILALVLEWLVMHSIRRAAKSGAAARRRG